MKRSSEGKRSPLSSSSERWWARPGAFLLFVLPLGVALCVADDPSNCLMVYKSGGAPAVFRSPKCSRWRPPAEYRRADCHVASLQGRRRSQEDRAFCALNTRIPFPGRKGPKEINVGLVAVFDGHNGDEASEMASKLLPEYFFLHLYFILEGIYTSALRKASGRLSLDGKMELTVPGFDWSWNSNEHAFYFERPEQILSRVFDKSFHLEILKKSLLHTVHDIDAAFSKEAYDNKLEAGSTATIIIKADDQVLVANIGDSKALLCSECLSSCHWRYLGQALHSDSGAMRRRRNYKLSHDGDSTCFCVKELTEDHHPDRNDERSRVEAAGGYVVEWGGVPRVNGELAVSRAIGDVSFKSYGVIPVPEVTEWQTLSDNDTYIVAATDGVFEKLSAQDICDIIWASQKGIKEIPNGNAQSLADPIVNRAFEMGSMDNMAAVVVPLQSDGTPSTLVSEDIDLEGDASFTLSNTQKQPYGSDGSTISFNLISMDYLSWILANINRILARGNDHNVSCFHLYENLKETRHYVFQSADCKEKTFHIQQAMPKALGLYHGASPLYLYSNSKLCMSFQLDAEEDKGSCANPEGFLRFLSLIGSVPFHDGLSNNSDSSGYDFSASRYILKRKFNRGSFGEVWLAYQSNCSEGGLSLKLRKFVDGCYHGDTNMSLDEDGRAQNNSSASRTSDIDVEDLYVLKRIMVERGNSAYLSGLRERYFGEIFLNASVAIKALASICISDDLTKANELNQQLQRNDSDLFEVGENLSSANTCAYKSRTTIVDYEEGLDHIARYVESFESEHNELWLVFQNEGQSLSKLIYTTEATGEGADNERDENTESIQIMRPSSWWHWLRKTEAGQKQMRSLIWQLLLALKSCHDRNITHRDIKPENMVICLEDRVTGKCLRGYPSDANMYNIKLRIIDFGSAINEFTIKHLYGSKGPSRLEETVEYTSPEAMLNISWSRGSPDITLKYDMWGVGVVMMELILGSPHVFQISSRTRSLLDQYLDGWTMEARELAYKLRAFMEMCILVPGSSPLHQSTGAKGEHGGSWLASWKCTEEAFSEQVKARDPLKLGFPDIWYLRLVRQLLIWHPACCSGRGDAFFPILSDVSEETRQID
ncbi:uncharacterized protein LOC116252432 isoform X3 [Nymphaea colorata]|uniref:uncharacterized protein LOC116252432 isoform X3 n=1 Tax=Nymphaea colorata TaxID=210225 RepID=UPI00129DD2FD|nr:uncharacterized protein LOC116252432 isoform X3 [Nymphaea colorata]